MHRILPQIIDFFCFVHKGSEIYYARVALRTKKSHFFVKITENKKKKKYSLIKTRQLHTFSIKPKVDVWLFVDFCVFSLNLPDLNLKLFCFDVQNSFRFRSVKNTKINKQLHVRVWFDRKKMKLSDIYLVVQFHRYVQIYSHESWTKILPW